VISCGDGGYGVTLLGGYALLLDSSGRDEGTVPVHKAGVVKSEPHQSWIDGDYCSHRITCIHFALCRATATPEF